MDIQTCQLLSRVFLINNRVDNHTDRMLYDGTEMTLKSFSHSKADFLVQMSPFWNPNGCQKGSKVVQYAVCWCILPLWNIWGYFLASRFMNWGIKQFHPVEPSVLANLRWQLWMFVVANMWVCPTLPGPLSLWIHGSLLKKLIKVRKCPILAVASKIA